MATLSAVAAQTWLKANSLEVPSSEECRAALVAANAQTEHLEPGTDLVKAYLQANEALLARAIARHDDRAEADFVLAAGKAIEAMVDAYFPQKHGGAGGMSHAEAFYARAAQAAKFPEAVEATELYGTHLDTAKAAVAEHPDGTSAAAILAGRSGSYSTMTPEALEKAVLVNLPLDLQVLIIGAEPGAGLQLQNFSVAFMIFNRKEFNPLVPSILDLTRALVPDRSPEGMKYNREILAGVNLSPAGGSGRPFTAGRATPGRPAGRKLAGRPQTPDLAKMLLDFLEGGEPNLPVQDVHGAPFVDAFHILERFNELGVQTKFLYDMQVKFQHHVAEMLDRYVTVSRASKRCVATRRDRVHGGEVDRQADMFVDSPDIDVVQAWLATRGYAVVPLGGSHPYMSFEEALAHPPPGTLQFEMARQQHRPSGFQNVPYAFRAQEAPQGHEHPGDFYHQYPAFGGALEPRDNLFHGPYPAGQNHHHQHHHRQLQSYQQFQPYQQLQPYQQHQQSQPTQQNQRNQQGQRNQQSQQPRPDQVALDAANRQIAELQRELATLQANSKGLAAGHTTATQVSS